MSDLAIQSETEVAVKTNTSVRTWLFTVCGLIIILIVFGGFVRLSRSGLSMVEWHILTGIIPPIGEAAWQETFEKYRQTPEYLLVNTAMTLQEYKTIYLIEYTHRLIARLAGLVVLIPLAVFLLRGTIPLRRSFPYIGVGVLFVLQGLLGWYMVQSGLVNEPHVSPFRLTIHLLLALTLLALCLWKAFEETEEKPPERKIKWTGPEGLSLGLLGLIVFQIAYGGLVAGLKAGDVSDTFPLMFGTLIPSGLFSIEDSWFLNLTMNEITVHFVHRWFAFVVLAVVGYLYYIFRKSQAPDIVRKSILAIVILVGIQVTLGVSVILFHVPISLALIHQAVAIFIFAAAFVLNYHLISRSG